MNFVSPFRWLGFVLCAWVCASANAADTDNALPPSPVSEDLAAFVLELGADEYEVRRSAFMKIWNMGRSALPAIREAKSSRNLQVAQAAAALEPLLVLGVSTQVSGTYVFDLLVNPDADKTLRLCQHENWKLAAFIVHNHLAVREELGNQTNRPLLSRIAQAAFEQGNPRLAWPILSSVLKHDAKTYNGADLGVWLAATVGIELDLEAEDVDTQAMHLLYSGNAAEAIQLEVTDSIRPTIVSRGALWSELARDEVRSALLLNRQSVARTAAEAICWEFAGDLERATEMWQQILQIETLEREPENKKQVDGQAPDVPRSDVRLQAELKLLEDVPEYETAQLLLAMVLDGRMDAVGTYLAEQDPTAAFSFFIGGNNYAKAFEVIQLDTDLANFDAWIAEREVAVQAELGRQSRNAATFGQTAQLGSLLVSLGFRNEAQQLIDMLADRSIAKPTHWTGGNSIVRWLGRGEPRELCLDVVAKNIRKLPRDTQEEIFRELFPELENTASALAQTAAFVRDANGNRISPVRMLDRLIDWDTGFFRDLVGPDAVYDWIQRARRRLIANREPTVRPEIYVKQLAELSNLARGCGLLELALDLGQEDSRDLGAAIGTRQEQWLEAAQGLLEGGEADDAARLLGELRESSEFVNDQVALILEVKALLLAGRYTDAVKLDQSRWLRPMATIRYFRIPNYSQVVTRLIESDDYARAKEYAELCYMLCAFSSSDVYWAASDYSQVLEQLGDFRASADVLRSRLLEGLQPGSQLVNLLVSNKLHNYLRFAAQRERLHRCIACVQSGDYEEAQRHLSVSRSLQPQDIEMVVQCYPRLVEAGQTELAEQFFNLYETSMLQQIETWPGDATAWNNLAWMYSQCGRNLDRALEMAQRATQLAPNSEVYLDTLAEVQFLLGDVDAAYQTALECIRLDPRDTRYRDNLQRFRGKPVVSSH